MPARLSLLIAGVLFATGGAALKSCDSLTPWTVASLRSALAALVLFGLLPSARRGLSFGACLTGCSYAATLLLFALANRETTAARAIFLQSTAPVWLLFLCPLILRERVPRSEILRSLGIFVGMTILLLSAGAESATAPDPGFGDRLGALSGLTWAGTMLGLRSLGKSRDAAPAAAAIGSVLSALVAAPFAEFGALGSIDGSTVLSVVWLGVFQVGLAYVALTRAIARVPAFEATLLLMIEPALSPLFAWAWTGESVASGTLIGGATIFVSLTGGAIWAGIAGRRQRSRTRGG